MPFYLQKLANSRERKNYYYSSIGVGPRNDSGKLEVTRPRTNDLHKKEATIGGINEVNILTVGKF